MRTTTFVLLGALAIPTWADDILWKKLETESDLVVLMRHTQPAGGNPLTWDEREAASADSDRVKRFERKVQSLIARYRGAVVSDNFHDMEYLTSPYRPAMTATALYESYRTCGETRTS